MQCAAKLKKVMQVVCEKSLGILQALLDGFASGHYLPLLCGCGTSLLGTAYLAEVTWQGLLGRGYLAEVTW